MTEKTKYLYENKEISDVLAQGFAKVCQEKPQFPINYLARFLKNYTVSNQEKTQLVDKLEQNKLIEERLKKLSLDHEAQELSVKESIKRREEDKNKFLVSISEEKQPESIINGFCEWVNNELGLSAVYLGELEYQSKRIDLLREDGEESHLELEKEKIVRFKYASNRQQGVIVGQTLGLESVVGKLLTQVPESQGEEQIPEDGEGGEIKQSEQESGSVYLSSVVGNQELKFFTYPKLGAYFASIMSIKSYLSEKLIDENVLKVESYRKLLAEYEKEMEDKETKFREQYEEKVHSGTDEKELELMEEEFEKEKLSTPKPTQEPFSFIERKFILCADTLGQDREITLEERNTLRELIKHLKTSWENQEQTQLNNDIQKQLTLSQPSHEEGHDSELPNYQEQLTTLFEEEDKDIHSNEEVEKVKDNEKLLELELNTLRFEKTQEYLSDEKYLKFWNHIQSLNVIKYHQILKQYLILLGYTKQQFCFPNTNQLDWLKTKQLLKSSQAIMHEKLNSLTPRGAKSENVPIYAKCSKINKNLENLEVLTIANYNIYLALILRLLQLYTKTRQQDKEARVAKIATEKELREQKLKEAEDKASEKKEKLDTLKADLEEKGELEAFDEEAWNNQYDEENPLIEVPEEISDDIDNDLEEGEEKQEAA